MPELVTVEQVNNALRLDLGADVIDPSEGESDTSRLDDIELKIAQATDIVLDYIAIDPSYCEWTAETVPGRVSAAIILVVRCLLDDSEESLKMLTGLSGKGDPNLTNPIVALLHRLRPLTIA